MLLKNSVQKGDKMKPRWLGPYKIEKVLEKGVLKISNPTTGLVLKKAVNQCRVKHFHQAPNLTDCSPGSPSEASPLSPSPKDPPPVPTAAASPPVLPLGHPLSSSSPTEPPNKKRKVSHKVCILTGCDVWCIHDVCH